MKARLAKKLLAALLRGKIIEIPKGGILVLKTEDGSAGSDWASSA